MADSRFLAGIAEGTRRALVRSASPRRLKRGEQLFARGDAPRWLFMVTVGEIKLWRTLEGGGVVSIALLGRGEIVGALSVARRAIYPANASAVSGVELVAWPLAEVRSLLEDDPVLSANLMRVVVRVTERLIQRVDEISATPVQQRIARVLLRAAGEMDDGVEDGAAELSLSRQGIAELASTTLHTTSRVVSGWVRAGLVGGGRGRVVIRDLRSLADVAGMPVE